jgi:hypothetical protein
LQESFVFPGAAAVRFGVFSAIEKGVRMRLDALYASLMLAGFVSSLTLTLIFGYFLLSREMLRRRRKAGRRRSRLSGYSVAVGLAFMQLARTFYQPDVAYLLEVKQDEDADEDDSGDPETPESRLRHFHRQLRRIRRGDPIDRLVWRM